MTNMKLNYKQYGDKENNLLILHGLFGSLDNWQLLAKKYAEHFTVYSIDLRNHGKSPHSDVFNYEAMAEDLTEFITTYHLKIVSIIGHSMGGKVAMQFAFNHPDLLDKLIIADMSPQEYKPHHDDILLALNNFPVDEITSRGEAEEIMKKYINDVGVRLFLLKNLDRIGDKQYQWKMNLPVITKNYDRVLEAVGDGQKYIGRTIFLKGEKSNYITAESEKYILELFPNAEIKIVPNAGHWVHAEAPQAFLDLSLAFLEVNSNF